MSTKTEQLGLYKYDPVADAAKTFNISTALNDNWDKIDADSKSTVKFDAAQRLTDKQKAQALANIGAATVNHDHSGRVIQPTSIELFPGASAGHGGYIDFHFNSDAADYTSRIYEPVKGVLKYNGHGIVSTANIVALLNVNIIFEKGFATYKNSAIKGSSVTFVQWRAGTVSTLTDSVLSTTPQNGSMIIIAKGLGSNPSVTLPVNILIINL